MLAIIFVFRICYCRQLTGHVVGDVKTESGLLQDWTEEGAVRKTHIVWSRSRRTYHYYSSSLLLRHFHVDQWSRRERPVPRS